MNLKVNEVVAGFKEEKAKQTSNRKVANQEQYNKILAAVITDLTFEVEDFEGIEDGKVIYSHSKPAEGFRDLVVAIFKKSGMSTDEAIEAAASVKLPQSTVKSIVQAVRTTDFIVCKELNGKVKMFKKAGLEVSMVIDPVKEQVRQNPKDKTKKTRIEARDKVKVKHTIHQFQKQMFVDKK
jgi:hypothetical protein